MNAPDEIYASFKTWVAENTPPGARLDLNIDLLHEIRVCCDGAVSWTTYHCCLDPGHDGDCFSRGKNVDFEPETGGPNAA